MTLHRRFGQVLVGIGIGIRHRRRGAIRRERGAAANGAR
jgi:hypothetical protein